MSVEVGRCGLATWWDGGEGQPNTSLPGCGLGYDFDTRACSRSDEAEKKSTVPVEWLERVVEVFAIAMCWRALVDARQSGGAAVVMHPRHGTGLVYYPSSARSLADNIPVPAFFVTTCLFIQFLSIWSYTKLGKPKASFGR
jgi:hypothetical protein